MVPPFVPAGVVAPLVLAHQGGWDEILMVAVPVGLFALLLRAANKRATRLAEQRTEHTDPVPPGDPAESADTETPGGGPTRPPAGPTPRPRGPI